MKTRYGHTPIENPKHRQGQTMTRMWSNRKSHSLLVGTQNGTATLEGSLAVSYKTKHMRMIQQTHSLVFTQKC